MLTGVRVREIMRNKVRSITDSANITDCAKKMASEEIGSLIIEQNGKVLGIITEQDLARKVLAKGLDPRITRVNQLMVKKVHTIGPDNDIYEAIVKMGKQRIKHLPVTENDKLIGIISYKDIIKLQPGLIELLSFKSSLPTRMIKKVFFNR